MMYQGAQYSPPPWPQGLHPRRAPVKPRVRASAGEDPLPLEDFVLALLDRRERGVINVFGSAGSGKSTALNHLAAILGPRNDVLFADNRYPAWVDVAADQSLVVFSSRDRRHESIHAFEMAPWSRDEIIEYLLSVHHDQCATVMQRILNGNEHQNLPGLPELWKPLLDLLATDPSIENCHAALRQLLRSYAPDAGARMVLSSFCLGLLTEEKSNVDVAQLINDAAAALRLTRVRPVQVFFAAEGIVADLQAHRHCTYLQKPPSRDLLHEIGMQLRHHPAARQRLERILSGFFRDQHPAAASLLLAADPQWRPPDQGIPHLAGAVLEHANWKSIRLWGVDLGDALLSRAVLTEAQLPDANFRGAKLTGAILARAWIERIHAAEADLSGADLTDARGESADFSSARLVGACLVKAKLKHATFFSADLTKARFCGADLSHARLDDATITDADFADCRLDHASLAGLSLRLACFRGATFRCSSLVGADLQGVHLPAADFRSACLVNADLTGASLSDSDFSGADLREAGLADIDWEGADLSDADLRLATFHLGSTRSGLVPGGVPSEGTRTGFYTDDYDEHKHRSPEEIRRANLRGADLVGAKVHETDFYLVDLRDAEYTDDQRRHFRRCGAIL